MVTLVTGASGFIGGALARTLVARGERVRILARPTSNLDSIAGLDLDNVKGNLADSFALSKATAGVSVIYHCAALASDWGPWADFEQANVTGVANLLDAAVAAGTVLRFVHVSTTDVYGYPRHVADETSPMNDVGYPYNRSKIMGERLVERCHRQTGLATTIIRPATVFGEHCQPFAVEVARLLRAGRLPLIAKGKTRAGLIYVADLIDAMTAAASAPQAVGQVYNLRDPADMTWEEFFLAYVAGLGLTERPRNLPGPLAIAGAHVMEATYKVLHRKNRPLLTPMAVAIMTRDQGYPISKAQRELGFSPQVGLEEGLRRTIEWLLSAEGQAAMELA